MNDTPGFIEPLAWDSEFFGFPIGKVKAGSVSLQDIAEVAQESKSCGFKCVYWLQESRSSDLLAEAQRQGFRWVDLRVELSRNVKPNIATPPSPGVRPARSDDLGQLQEIAEATQEDTRFHKDGLFPPDRAKALYSKWIERDLDQNEVWVGAEEADNLTGFVSLAVNPSTAVATIGLVSVASGSQGQGWGRQLMSAALHSALSHGCQSCRVVTQGTNVGALGLYQSCGFRVNQTHHWMHLWPEEI